MRYKLFVVIAAMSWLTGKSQTISGNLLNYQNDTVSKRASVLFKSSRTSTLTREFIMTTTGHFEKKLTDSYDTLVIEVHVNGFYPIVREVINPQANKHYQFDLRLIEKTVNQLDEVVLIARKKSYEIKGDTLAYDVSAFKDADDDKIIDIIKKLPGVTVNEASGEIKYKGKYIETVTLGDVNLFGRNYTLGTKNINVDIVERIEAIDNYSENPLLKGIEQGGKVALNLELKKGKLDLSGTAEAATGQFADGKVAIDAETTLLGINKVYKSFSVVGFNNVGVNKTPFDYFGYSVTSSDQAEGQNSYADKIIAETRFSNLLPSERINDNNQLFVNHNGVFKVSPKLSAKVNLYYLHDRLNFNKNLETDYIIDQQSFYTSDQDVTIKTPEQYRMDFDVTYDVSSNFRLKYQSQIRQEYINTQTDFLKNGTESYTTRLRSDDFYWRNQLKATYKLSDRNALQLLVYQAYNKVPQYYRISPDLRLDSLAVNKQYSAFKKNYSSGILVYRGSGVRDKYAFSVGVNKVHTPYLSYLNNQQTTAFKNQFSYTKQSVFQKGVYHFNRGDWEISPSYTFKYLRQHLNRKLEKGGDKKRDLLINARLDMQYHLNEFSFLRTYVGLEHTAFSETYLYLHPVLTGQRNLTVNTPKLALKKRQFYTVEYYNNNLPRQLALTATARYNRIAGNYLSAYTVTEDMVYYNYFFSPVITRRWEMNARLVKFVNALSSTVKLKVNLSKANSYGIVNQSKLTATQTRFINSRLYFKTAFLTALNFENILSWGKVSSKRDSDSKTFSNQSLQNTFKILWSPSYAWRAVLSSAYHLPDILKSREDYLFTDFWLQYQPQDKSWSLSLAVNNIGNEVNYQVVNVSEVATMVYGNRILPRHVVLGVEWSF